MVVSEALKASIEKLNSAGVSTPRLDAEVILGHVLGVDRYRFITDPDRELSDNERSRFLRMIKRRLDREPVAYITGSKEFYSLDFIVGRDVLIPRPETELLVDLVIYYAGMNGSVLDLCTGSGAIAVAVKHMRNDLAVSASDISKRALSVARKNSMKLLGRAAVKFYTGDLYEPFTGKTFDIIVCNPPYVNRDNASLLEKELFHEPSMALFADDNGRAVIRRVISGAAAHLEEHGRLVMEIGCEMKDFVIDAGAGAGFSVSVLNDHAGLPRAAVFGK